MSGGDKEPRWIEITDDSSSSGMEIDPGEKYHDLGAKNPQAPVPRGPGDVIIHRAVLSDLTGVSAIMDWISDGDLVIIEMAELLKRETELHIAVTQIKNFVERDLSGSLLRLGNTRLLLLPSQFESTEDLK
jgi:SepF-like predicted cell division protein (DUF552 family)|tara:strand:+ start:319 stop:711 length:393 start_codon:yes stop_codon:yes gene_type:complete